MSENDDRDRPGGASSWGGSQDPWQPPAQGAPSQPPAGNPPPVPYEGYQPPPPYEPSAPYGQPPAQDPYGQPYGSAAPAPGGQPAYGQPYGGSPYAGVRSPEAARARTSAITSVILNAVTIFLCGNLFAIAGTIMAGLAISKVDSDLPQSRKLTRWSWIVFGVGLVLTLLGWALVVALVISAADTSSDF